MSTLQLLRTAQGGIRDSDLVRLFGQWENDLLITTQEVVLFEMPTGSDVPRPIDRSQMHKLMGATCLEPGSGLELGSIVDFDNPRHTLNPLSPLVWLEPKHGLQFPSWSSEQALPVDSITEGLAVSFPDLSVTGTVALPVANNRQYLDDKEVRACVLRFDITLRNVEGMPVVTEVDGEQKLVGMLFNLFTKDGESFSYCFPAADIPTATP